jgi:lactate racemase
MKVDMAFSTSGLELELPGQFRYKVLEARSAKPLADPLTTLQTAIANPTGCVSLRELAQGKKSAAISVCDITRPVPNSFTLPPVLRALEDGGIPASEITILIATGLHRPATPEEIRKIVGEEIAAKYTVVNHEARNLEAHRHLGKSSTGTPIHIDERFVGADFRMSLGFIEPHLMLGYSGGRKLVVPGLAAQETIKVLHSPRFMRDPRTHEGYIEGNPLHNELTEIAAIAGHDFILDVSLTREREIAGVFAGTPVEAHRKGVEFVSEVMLEELDEPADAVITTSAGYPLDLTYYQSIKGVTAAQHAMKAGGRILLVAACEEGAGAPEFRKMLKQFPTAEGFMDAIAEAPVIVDQWQLEKLALVTRKADVLYYVPGLPADYYPTLWGTACATPEDAVASLTNGLPDGALIAVIPEGPYVLARPSSAVASEV